MCYKRKEFDHKGSKFSLRVDHFQKGWGGVVKPIFYSVAFPMKIYQFSLTVSARQIKTDVWGNSVDPDETARHEPSHQDLHCLQFCF